MCFTTDALLIIFCYLSSPRVSVITTSLIFSLSSIFWRSSYKKLIFALAFLIRLLTTEIFTLIASATSYYDFNPNRHLWRISIFSSKVSFHRGYFLREYPSYYFYISLVISGCLNPLNFLVYFLLRIICVDFLF